MKDSGTGFLNTIIENGLESIVNLRRQLHQIPELAFCEYKTTETLQAYIRKIPGVEIRSGIAGTGFVATLAAEKGGKCIAFRADMDALPIVESNDLPYVSQHEGRMHACGHDGHSAILAGLVLVLSQCQDQLRGPVKFIFQPAEEGGGGARLMVEQGVLQAPSVDVIFGLHGWPTLDVGRGGAVVGPFFASTNVFDITIKGKGGHAAFPHQTIDPLPIAAALVQSLQTLVSRNTDPLDSCVVSICEINGGNTYNVIPDQVTLRGTLRCFTKEHQELMIRKIETMTGAIARGHGAGAEVVFKPEGYPVLRNDLHETAFFKSVAMDVFGDDFLSDVSPTMGGEDFAYYAQEVPACFWLLGVKDPQAERWPLLHTPAYNFNDDALRIGMKLQAEIALRFQDR